MMFIKIKCVYLIITLCIYLNISAYWLPLVNNNATINSDNTYYYHYDFDYYYLIIINDLQLTVNVHL